MKIGILQELWSAAVAGSRWRHPLWRGGEDGCQVAAFATGVEHGILAEEPLLQTVRLHLAFLSQHGDAVVEFCRLAAWFGECFVPSLLDAAQFRFLILALSDHLLLLLGG